MPVIINQSRLHVWRIGITGLAGTISVDLDRYPNATTKADAAEVVSVAEIGSTGHYALTYTPTLAQKYIGLATESTLGLTFQFEDDVVDAPSPETVDDAYCSVADVVAFANIGIPSSTTTPTESQVLGFMAKRAGFIYGTLSEVFGDTTPGPANYSTTIDTSTDKGKALSQAARFVNAIGAAMDQLEAAGANQGPARTERVAELSTAYRGSLNDLMKAARSYRGWGGVAQTHLSDGSITQPSTVSRQQSGMQFNGLTRF